ncbi:MAG: alpha-galactosidase, partial [Proteobacteria bacterium]
MKRRIGFLALAASWIAASAVAADTVSVETKSIRVEFNDRMHSRIVATFDGKAAPLGDFGPSEFVNVAGGAPLQDFHLTGHKQENVRDDRGHGRRLTITGTAAGLQKRVVVTVYDEIPRMAFYQVRYTNQSDHELKLSGWANNRYSVQAEGAAEPAFWSYQPGSYRNRPDWILPLKGDFKQDNYLGMNATDYGGGTPVADVWRRDVGIAVGHLERAPKLVALPVTRPDA